MKFSDFLIEAKFAESDLARIITAFEKRLPRHLNTKLYRYGGSSGLVKLPNGSTAYLYFFGTKAFQLRTRGGHVLGIDVWPQYTIDTGPSFTIEVADLAAPTLIAAISKLAKIIKSPKADTIEIEPELEEERIFEMAKRTDSATFFSMVQASGFNPEQMTWDQIRQVADANDVLIPGYVRGQQVDKRHWSTVPGAMAEDPAKVEVGAKGNHTLFIKVTAQDPNTKKFVSAANSPEAQALYAQLNGVLTNKGKPSQAELKDPKTLFGHLVQLTEMVCRGTLRSLIVYGGPGLGKTYTMMQVVKEVGLTKGTDYVKLSGKATPTEIYKTLFMFRKGGLVIFDDLDSMWGNEDATNILKAALDSSRVREISWQSANTINVSKMGDDEREELFTKIDAQIEENPVKVRYPSSFEFTGRVIFISNLKKDDFDSAILSRSAKISMDLTPDQVLERMKTLLPTLGGEDVSMTKKEELLDHLVHMNKSGEIDMVTMREFVKGLDIVRSGAPNWKDLLSYA